MRSPVDDSILVGAHDLEVFARDVFVAARARPSEAATVAAELIRADRSGVPSHGVVRVVEYLEAIDAGRINLAANVRIITETAATAIVDGDRAFGQVTGAVALDTATRKAAHDGVGLVIVRNAHHIGRIGSLCEAGAAHGHLVLALVAVGIPGPVAPFGGREGRLGTNPIAFGIPTGGAPIVADFATAAMPEGGVNLARQRGDTLPAGVLIDSAGRPSTDPGALYEDPPGAILPFGGTWGHRGFALNLMVELLAGTLAGYGPHAPDRTSNCMFLIAVDPDVAHPGIDFEALAAETAEFVASAAPAEGAAVMLPGEIEARNRESRRESVPVASTTLNRLDEIAKRFGLSPVSRPS